MPRPYGLGIPASRANFDGDPAMLPYAVNGTGLTEHPYSITPATTPTPERYHCGPGRLSWSRRPRGRQRCVTWPPPTARNHSASPAAAATAVASRIVMSVSRGALPHWTAP